MLRELNEQSVLEFIFHGGPVPVPEIARHVGLSKPTVSLAVDHLLKAGVVHEAGRSRGKPGRTASLYSVDSRVGFVVAADVGGAKVKVAVSNVYGEILSELQQPTDPRGGAHVVAQIAETCRDAVASAGASWKRVLSLCGSTPGAVDPVSGRLVLSYNISGLNDTDLHGPLAEELGVDVLVDNDVNLAAVGEKWKGLAKEHPTFVFLAAGTGVGMGLVLDNELFRGSRGAAGEAAFLPVAEDPFDPKHLRRGALEDSAGTAGVMEHARTIMAQEKVPGSVKEIFRMAATGDTSAGQVVEREASLLALALVSAVAIVDPELVVLGGGIGANPLLLEPVREAVSTLLAQPPRIERSILGDRASLYGALALALRDGRQRLFADKKSVLKPIIQAR